MPVQRDSAGLLYVMQLDWCYRIGVNSLSGRAQDPRLPAQPGKRHQRGFMHVHEVDFVALKGKTCEKGEGMKEEGVKIRLSFRTDVGMKEVMFAPYVYWPHSRPKYKRATLPLADPKPASGADLLSSARAFMRRGRTARAGRGGPRFPFCFRLWGDKRSGARGMRRQCCKCVFDEKQMEGRSCAVMRYDIQEARLNEITGTPELLSSDKLKTSDTLAFAMRRPWPKSEALQAAASHAGAVAYETRSGVSDTGGRDYGSTGR
ncbi:hypothetical protein BJV77DRAFT_963847 [Russula vinacea]|nr:hypothetical protein BJV77DRAFT_963847 [Russula vinacea]